MGKGNPPDPEDNGKGGSGYSSDQTAVPEDAGDPGRSDNGHGDTDEIGPAEGDYRE